MRSEAGQGLLEYMLLLVIILVLILGLAYQFNSAFKAWASAFFDGYIACLLETGDLPGVSPQCQEEYASFDLNKGQRLLDGNLGGAGAAGGGKNNGQNRDSQKQNSAAAAGGGEALASGAGGNRIGFARLGDNGRPATVREGTATGDSEGSDSKTNFGMNNTRVGHVNRNTGRRESVSMIYSYGDEESEEKTKPTAANAGQVSGGGEEVLRPNRIVDKSQADRQVSSLDEKTSFSIGAILRWLIIACIVIAMIVFFGGQLLQISKSREKGGD